MQKGLFMKRSLPIQPWYLERHPDDHSLTINSRPNQMTTSTSKWNKAASATSSYSWSSMVENTLSPRHRNTMKNLKQGQNSVKLTNFLIYSPRVWLTLSHDKLRQFDLLAFPRSCRVLLVAFGIWHLFDWPCNSKACLKGSFAFLFHVECH